MVGGTSLGQKKKETKEREGRTHSRFYLQPEETEETRLVLYRQIDIELTRDEKGILGFGIVGSLDGPGVFVTDVFGGGAAAVEGQMAKGDQVNSRISLPILKPPWVYF